MNFVGKHFLYPDQTGNRIDEGGRRISAGKRAKRAEKLVSVITVCWNSGKTIEQTIQSIEHQTYSNVEHIIIDGASTDNTLENIRRHKSKLEYFVSEPDNGLYYAMNKGLELAQGAYILILNSDDWYTPDCISELVAAQEETNSDFVSALAHYVNFDGSPQHETKSTPFDAGVYLRMPLRHETMLISNELYDRVGGYNTQLRINADRDLTKRLFELGCTHHEIQKPLMFFRNTGVSSTQLDSLRAERRTMLHNYFPDLAPEDVAILANLESIAPDDVRVLHEKYNNQILRQALNDYGRSRKLRGDLKWGEFHITKEKSAPRAENTPVSAIKAPIGITVGTFSTRDHGGAGQGTQRRVEALRNAGVDARIYCLFKKTDKPYVHEVPPAARLSETLNTNPLNKIWQEQVPVSLADEPGLVSREMFSETNSLVDFDDIQPTFDEIDIVHFHWVAGLFDYDKTLAPLKNTPVTWTLADMNAFTGGCHYSEGCEGYKNECRACPLLSGSDLAHKNWKRKSEAYSKIKNLNVICPSQWLGECAAESSLFRDRPIHVIPNAIPVDRFQPTNKMVARKILNLPLNKKIIAFGAESLSNERKGGDLLRDCLQRMNKRDLLENVEGLFFGGHSLELPIKTHSMGRISDEFSLSLIYASADVFAFPSREDNAPLTVVESLLSGTPVVSFPVGNVPEILFHQKTGYIARNLDIDDFSTGLEWALKDANTQTAIIRSALCHSTAKAYNNPETAAKRHIALYEDILGRSDNQCKTQINSPD